VTTGERIRVRRQARGLTHEQLAWRAGVSLATVSRLERGVGHQPNLSTLQRIAGALETSVTDLLSEAS
jgi:transcriptional regulator with XRE-family HTH domain